MVSKSKSLKKSISWRLVASSSTFVTVFLISFFISDSLSSVEIAGVISLVEIPSKFVIYYIHERVWERF